MPGIFHPQIDHLRTVERNPLINHRGRPEKRATKHRDEILAGPIRRFHPKIIDIGGSTGIQAISAVKRPYLSRLLIITGSIQFHVQVLENTMSGIPYTSDTDRAIHQGLHRIVEDRVDLASPMLHQSLHRRIEMETGSRVVVLYPRRDPDGKRLLMHILPENKALPVHPHIQVESLRVIQQLQARLGIAGQIQLRIIKRLYQIMVGSAVNISQHDVHMIREGHLRPEIGQHMYPFLVLVSLPISDILISHARIFIRPMIDQHMDTRLQLDIPQGIINRFALYPKPRQRIPLGKFTRILVILEEANIIQLHGQLPGLLRVDMIIRLIDTIRDLRLQRGRPTPQSHQAKTHNETPNTYILHHS